MTKNADMPIMPTESLGDTGEPYYDAIPSYGLTKREHFAAMAMQGLVASPRGKFNCKNEGELIFQAVSIADALLAELETPNEQS